MSGPHVVLSLQLRSLPLLTGAIILVPFDPRYALPIQSPLHDRKTGSYSSRTPLTQFPGHETVGVVAAIGPKVKGFEIGERVCADNSELCGECFYCRRGELLLCEHFEAHGVTMDGGFAEYCAYPGMDSFHFAFGAIGLKCADLI